MLPSLLTFLTDTLAFSASAFAFLIKSLRVSSVRSGSITLMVSPEVAGLSPRSDSAMDRSIC